MPRQRSRRKRSRKRSRRSSSRKQYNMRSPVRYRSVGSPSSPSTPYKDVRDAYDELDEETLRDAIGEMDEETLQYVIIDSPERTVSSQSSLDERDPIVFIDLIRSFTANFMPQLTQSQKSRWTENSQVVIQLTELSRERSLTDSEILALQQATRNINHISGSVLKEQYNAKLPEAREGSIMVNGVEWHYKKYGGNRGGSSYYHDNNGRSTTSLVEVVQMSVDPTFVKKHKRIALQQAM